ncbi:sigma factor-like helix-turn-helix DNA-binding protein [Actinacidiphila alni]|uniref:sigma factor-like helix-turn-helix DNA-binding protein n=1 Tax=Actinacidiphila alni TaxID=380248 RepID=UPI003452305B
MRASGRAAAKTGTAVAERPTSRTATGPDAATTPAGRTATATNPVEQATPGVAAAPGAGAATTSAPARKEWAGAGVGIGAPPAVIGVPVAARGAATPEEAFDALHAYCAGGLVRQVRVLTGNPRLAESAVGRAFDQAWQRWPEVAGDADPVGWLRASAYAYALAPWQRWVPAHRHRPDTAPKTANALQTALLGLPPEQRRALLLYDGLGLDLPETAAEIESSTLATAARITHARTALTEAVPELSEDGQPLSVSLGELLADTGAGETAAGAGVRDASERGVKHRTVAALALTAVIVIATAVTMVTARDHAEPLTPRHKPAADTPGAPRSVDGSPQDPRPYVLTRLDIGKPPLR